MLKRDCSSTSNGASTSPTSIGSDSTKGSSERIPVNSFLSTDNAESSTDGPDESCGSEGHADTSSTNGSNGREGDGSSDSDASTHENARLLPGDSKVAIPESARSNRWVRSEGKGQQPPHGSASTPAKTRTFAGCARRPVRQQVMVPRKSVLRRCSASQPSEVSLSPFGRAVPPVPEDFLGRNVDAWSVLQHLSERRAVVVCGEAGTEHGIGKSALLDAVHRAFAFQMGGVCVAVPLRALSDVDVLSESDADRAF